MKRFIRITMVLTLVVAACGGSGDDGTTTTVVAGGDSGSTTTTTTTTTSAPATVDPGSGSSTDFCMFIEEYAENADISPVTMTAAELEEIFRANLSAIEQAAQMAPPEIAGDVSLFATAFGGFIELLEENNFDFLAMGEAALDDPRLTALEDPELEAAGKRVEAFCGFEDGDFIQTPQAGGGDGGTGGLPGQSLPDDFPTDLVPPGGEVVASVDLGGVGTSVTFDVQSPVDDVIAYYTDVVGPPAADIPEPRGALWTGSFQDGTLNIVVAETAPNVTQVNVTFG
ncbi:MAG: hypothetical protein GY720_16565 [bacterium]|nr:hypothetical protein [bacterium]